MSTAFQRGMEAIRVRDMQAAEQCFRQAVDDDPSSAEARMWLGQIQCANGARIEGVGLLAGAGHRFLETDGVSPRLYEIVGQLQQWRAFDHALSILDAIVARVPLDARSRQMRAATLAMLNRSEDALAEALELEKLAVGNQSVQVFLGSLEADTKRHDDAERRLRAVLVHKPAPRDAFRALKEMARLLDRKGAYADAFKCMESAGAFARQVPEYAQVDRKIIPDLIAANRAGFSRDLLHRWAGAQLDDRAAPVFVMGFYRSGTTLTQEVLAAHPDTIVSDEESLIKGVISRINQMVPGQGSPAEKLATLTLEDVRTLRRHYWHLAEGALGIIPGNKVFVDKYTLNTIDVALISTLFPDGKLIFMIRDPRDVCISSLQQLMPPTAATVHLLTWHETVALYRMVMDWWRHIRPMLSAVWIECRYEDAIADFEGAYRRMFDFAGLPWNQGVANFHRNARGKHISTPSRGQVSQPIYDTSLARWRRYAEPVASASQTLAPFIEAFGYPTD